MQRGCGRNAGGARSPLRQHAMLAGSTATRPRSRPAPARLWNEPESTPKNRPPKSPSSRPEVAPKSPKSRAQVTPQVTPKSRPQMAGRRRQNSTTLGQSLTQFGPNRANVGHIGPIYGQHLARIARSLPPAPGNYSRNETVSRFRPLHIFPASFPQPPESRLAIFVRSFSRDARRGPREQLLGPMLIDSGPILVESGPFLVDIGRMRGQTRTMF